MQTYVSICATTLITFGTPSIKVTRRELRTKPYFPDDGKKTCAYSKQTQLLCSGWEQATANCTFIFFDWVSTRMGYVMLVTHQKLLHIFYWFVLNTMHNAQSCWRNCARSASLRILQTSSATQEHRVMFNTLSTWQIEPSEQINQQ